MRGNTWDDRVWTCAALISAFDVREKRGSGGLFQHWVMLLHVPGGYA
jgi:hypothetical protein